MQHAANAVIIDAFSEEECPFNAQILTAASGATNTGIDDLEVFGVCRPSFHPVSLMLNKKGWTGCHPLANSTAHWYMLCILLESILLYSSNVYTTHL
jgi:hypothetical protein